MRLGFVCVCTRVCKCSCECVCTHSLRGTVLKNQVAPWKGGLRSGKELLLPSEFPSSQRQWGDHDFLRGAFGCSVGPGWIVTRKDTAHGSLQPAQRKALGL